jgi:hypothetical protein
MRLFDLREARRFELSRAEGESALVNALGESGALSMGLANCERLLLCDLRRFALQTSERPNTAGNPRRSTTFRWVGGERALSGRYRFRRSSNQANLWKQNPVGGNLAGTVRVALLPHPVMIPDHLARAGGAIDKYA